MLLVPFIDRSYVFIKSFLLIGVQDFPDTRACPHMNCLELRIGLCMQIPCFLRRLIENLAELLRLRIGEIQYLLEMRHRNILVKTSGVR